MLELFQLFNWCQPMGVTVEDLTAEATRLGLSKSQLQIAAESRLRAARIYGGNEETDSFLYVRAGVTRRAFTLDLEYRKLMMDVASKQLAPAPSWTAQHYGTHGGDTRTIMALLAERLDEFLANYLRVNERICEALEHPP